MTTEIKESVKIASFKHVSYYESSYELNKRYIWRNPIIDGFDNIYQNLNKSVYNLQDITILCEFYHTLCVFETEKILEVSDRHERQKRFEKELKQLRKI